MSLGTIHPVAADLFVVEGDAAVAAAAVYRWRERVYLLDTGVGPEQRSSIRTLVASYGELEELVLLSSGAFTEPGNNDDLLVELPAHRRRHVRLSAPGPQVAASALTIEVEPYEALGREVSITVGSDHWSGWDLAPVSLQLLRLGLAAERYTVVHIPEFRTLLLPGLLALERLPAQVTTSLRSLAASMRVVSTGGGPPLDRARFQAILGGEGLRTSLIDPPPSNRLVVETRPDDARR